MKNINSEVISSDLTHFANEAKEGLSSYLTVLDELPESKTKELIKNKALYIKNNIERLNYFANIK